jgi:hypothetical protein
VSRILARGLVVAALASLLLVQMQGAPLLWAWEILLIALVLWQAREIPGGDTRPGIPLFPARQPEASRLPRSVVAAEVATTDALSGHAGRGRRLRPILARIAGHRLDRHGIDLETPGALKVLDESEWKWLTGREDQPLTPSGIETLVSRLEDL